MAGKNNVFVDTWGWLVLGHAKDLRHSEVTSLLPLSVAANKASDKPGAFLV